MGKYPRASVCTRVTRSSILFDDPLSRIPTAEFKVVPALDRHRDTLIVSEE
jgi:hypothetical protein